MGALKKKRRKIIVNNIEYYWYIVEEFYYSSFKDNDFGVYKVLTIVSEDKKFIVKYPFCKSIDSDDFIEVIGQVFGGDGEWGHGLQRVICPKWENKQCIITPSIVEKMIRWCMRDKINEFIDWRGARYEYSQKSN